MNGTEIRCQGCGAQNRLSRDGLLNMSQSPACGRCKARLLPAFGVPLTKLDPSCYIHDLDRQALEALHRIPGIQTVLRKVLRKSVELGFRLYHHANFVRVSERQVPQLHVVYEEAAHAIGVEELPQLYVFQEPRIDAYTWGVERAIIAVSTGTLEQMDQRELLGVLAHELGHWQCHHILYKSAAMLLGGIAGGVAVTTLGLGNLALTPLQLALRRWDRASELTADRAALLAVREPQIVLRILMKLAGGSQRIYEQMDFGEFLAQAEEFEEVKDEGFVGRIYIYLDNLFRTHPYPIWRARELVRWVHSGAYLKILGGDYPY
jgi:Zn-dependent protease with chaperone function